MNTTALFGAAISLIFSFFFSGIEVAFLSANKLQIELTSKHGSVAGKIIAYFTTKPSWLIGTTLIGHTVSVVSFGIFTTQLIVTVLQPYFFANSTSPVFIAVFFITIVILFITELLSKSLFLVNPNKVIYALAIPLACSFIILFPLTFFIIFISKFILTYILRLDHLEEKQLFGLADLGNYLESKQHVKHEDEDITLDTKIFHNALEFKTVRVRECMIPRTEIMAVNVDVGIQVLREAFVESGHSKIIIYRDTIDDVIGYCHSSALFKNPKRIEEILTPIIMVPETTLANELMIRFINQRKSLALVVDEFGGTSGIVSMEDVIEEIFGEIEDEHDQDDLVEQRIDETTFVLSGRLEIDYLNETYGWSLPVGEYETLGGLILSQTENIPQPGEVITIEPYVFTVQSTQDNRIDTLKMVISSTQ
jgi:CBS domain containing-hemolysin-like protein